MKILDRYLLREIVAAFLVSLGFIILVMLMNELFYLAEIFLTREVPIKIVLRVLFFLLPSILALALPLAFMAGVLGGLGRLAGDRETEAMRLLGISPGRVLKPVWFLGTVLFLVCLIFTFWLTPAANYRWLQTMVNSVLSGVRLELEPGRFVESLPGKVLYMESLGKDREWRDILMYQKDETGRVEITSAREARLELQPERREAWILLEKGRVYRMLLEDPESLNLIEFERSQQSLDLKGLSPSFLLEKKSREKNIRELWLDRERLAGKNNPESRLVALELHKRLSLPATCFLFVFLGVGLGWRRWPGGKLGGFGLSLLVILAYYFLLVAGEQKALRGSLAPWLAMWLPNLLILAVGLNLYFQALRKDRSGEIFRPVLIPEVLSRFSEKHNLFSKKTVVTAGSRRTFLSRVDGYLFSWFFRLLVQLFLALLLVMSSVTFLLRLELIGGGDKTMKDLLAFIWFKVPEFILFSLLLAIPAAAALSLGLLYRRKEMQAFICSGLSYWRVVRSLLIFGLLLAPLLFVWQDRVLSRSNFQAEELWARLSDRPVRTFSYLNRYWIRSRADGRFYHYDLLRPEERLLSRLLILEEAVEGPGFRKMVYASEAKVQGDSLILKGGWERSFSGQKSELERFSLTTLELTGAEEYFFKEWKEPATMKVSELKHYARELEDAGLPGNRFLLEAWFRLAFSLSGLVLILLACASAGLLAPKGFLWPLAAGLVGVFLYWQGLAIFRSLGLAGLLGTSTAAWSAPIGFLLLGIYLLSRVKT
ncbi:MAG: YjgP/YjgQ family permease [Candidatus Aminicenantes bacterium]|nr:YjgP/YjgQ family permease [Candidatus Aminicenantes bacterium]